MAPAPALNWSTLPGFSFPRRVAGVEAFCAGGCFSAQSATGKELSGGDNLSAASITACASTGPAEECPATLQQGASAASGVEHRRPGVTSSTDAGCGRNQSYPPGFQVSRR